MEGPKLPLALGDSRAFAGPPGPVLRPRPSPAPSEADAPSLSIDGEGGNSSAHAEHNPELSPFDVGPNDDAHRTAQSRESGLLSPASREARRSAHAQGTQEKSVPIDPYEPPLRVSANNESEQLVVLERELARSYRIERALREVGRAMGTRWKIDELLRFLLDRTIDALEAERATLYSLYEPSGDPSENILESSVFEGGASQPIRLRLGEGIAGDVAQTGQPTNVPDAYEDPRFSREWDEKSGFRTRAVLCAPLRSMSGRVVGVLQVLNKRGGGPFDDDDLALLDALAAQAGTLLAHARLIVIERQANEQLRLAQRELQAKVKNLNVLYAIERATARAGTKEELVVALLPEVARALDARTAYVVLADNAGDLELLHLGSEAVSLLDEVTGPFVYGPDSDRPSIPPVRSGVLKEVALREVLKLRIKANEGLVGAAMETGEAIVTTDLAADPRASARICSVLFPGGEDRGAPAVVVPMTREAEGAFGALAVIRRAHQRPFVRGEIEFLRLLALNASTGFQLEAERFARVREERLGVIGSMLSGVIHDLKTPMTVISGYTQLMATTDDQALREKYANLILRQFDHIGAMQREVLEFARGGRTMLIRKVYLAKFFEEIEEQVRREIERRGVQIELVMEVKDRGTARFDENKLTRAIHNLVRNAIEAMGDAGTLTITVSRSLMVQGHGGAGSELQVTVSDNGPGLPAEIETHLFESFVTSGKATGTGLGLAIVRKIAEDHQGTVEVSSSCHGARFTIRLPQVAA